MQTSVLGAGVVLKVPTQGARRTNLRFRLESVADPNGDRRRALTTAESYDEGFTLRAGTPMQGPKAVLESGCGVERSGVPAGAGLYPGAFRYTRAMIEQLQRVYVGSVGNLPEGSQTEVIVGERHVVVINDGGQYYALRNNCTHKDFPLLGGDVSNGRITCEKHGAKFELATGKAKTLPAVKSVQIYKTEVEGGEVYVLPL